MTRQQFFASIAALFAGGLMRKKEEVGAIRELLEEHTISEAQEIWDEITEEEQEIYYIDTGLTYNPDRMRCGKLVDKQ